MAKLPPISQQHRICVICEGLEDIPYFNRLLDLIVWSSAYKFTTINAKSASTIPARFEDAYHNNQYEIILIFCDTDKALYREYSQIKKKINRFLGKQKADEKLIIFANPCTMQIILSHFGEVSLTSQGKKTNAALIEELTGVKDYDAHEEQVKALCSGVTRRTYQDMKQRVAAINFPDTTPASTNFSVFLDRFESDDTKWIKVILDYLRS